MTVVPIPVAKLNGRTTPPITPPNRVTPLVCRSSGDDPSTGPLKLISPPPEEDKVVKAVNERPPLYVCDPVRETVAVPSAIGMFGMSEPLPVIAPPKETVPVPFPPTVVATDKLIGILKLWSAAEFWTMAAPLPANLRDAFPRLNFCPPKVIWFR